MSWSSSRRRVINKLLDWLLDWLRDWLFDRLPDRLPDWLLVSTIPMVKLLLSISRWVERVRKLAVACT
jgi:hypothetical protein